MPIFVYNGITVYPIIHFSMHGLFIHQFPASQFFLMLIATYNFQAYTVSNLKICIKKLVSTAHGFENISQRKILLSA
jgi:hypothetical protein